MGSGAGRSHSRSRIVPYAAAKAGAHGLVRQLAVELAPFNVLCNVVAPGFVLSPHGVADWARRSQAEQVMELFEMILIEIVEESSRADGMPGDFEIVDVPVPVLADLVDRRHARHYTIGAV